MHKMIFVIFGIVINLSIFAQQNQKEPNRDLVKKTVQKQSKNFDNKTVTADALFVSNAGEFTPGTVEKHKLPPTAHFSTTPIFITGTDDYSINWVKTNTEYLKKIHAIGLITDLHSKKQLKDFEMETGLKAMPANIEGFSKIVGTTHYPFLIYQGWVIR